MTRDLIQFERLDMRQRPGLLEPGDVRNMLSAWWFGLVMVLVALIMLFAPDLWLPTPRSPADVAAPRRPGRA